jgi:arabinogalactan oligomer/maltooligosaccharide transport system substrate-binding protein
MKRNVFVLVLLGVLALSSLAPVLAQDEGLLIYADDTRIGVMQDVADRFTAEYGVPVELREIGGPEGRDDLLNFGAAGESADILIGAHDYIGPLVANGAIVPIDLTGMEDQFLPAALNMFTYQGQVWGLPFAIESTALIRNTDLVPDPPATWEEVADLCLELRDAGLAEYSILIQENDTYHMSPVFTAFGGYIFGFNEDGSYNPADIGFASEGMLAFGEWIGSMVETGCLIPGVDNDVATEYFNSGETAMWITGPWFQDRLDDSGVPYAITPFPGTEAGGTPAQLGGTQGFYISAFSQNQLLAETFVLDYVATPETMQALFEANPRPPAYLAVDTSAYPHIQEWTDAVATAAPMPVIPEMNAVWASGNNAFTLILQGADPTETLLTANDQIVEAIDLARELSSGRTVVLVGSLQAAAGCDGDWNPGCLTTKLEDQGDGIYSASFTLPAGDYEYKIAINGSWDENYGADGVPGGDNITLSLSEETDVTFTFDDNTHVVTAIVNE